MQKEKFASEIFALWEERFMLQRKSDPLTYLCGGMSNQ